MESQDWLNPSEQMPEDGQAIEVKYTVNGNEYISHTIYRPEKELVPIWVKHTIIGWRLLIMENIKITL